MSGSISGKVKTVKWGREYDYEPYTFSNIGLNLATIYIYKAEDVESIDWELTGPKYIQTRKRMFPRLGGEFFACYIPDKSLQPEITPIAMYTTIEEDIGNFKFENIEFGKYVVLVDKYLYADYVITDINIDSANSDIYLGEIQIQAGDVNKDGILDLSDSSGELQLIAGADKIEKQYMFDLNDENVIDTSSMTDMAIMRQALAYYTNPNNPVNTVIKHVELLSERIVNK